MKLGRESGEREIYSGKASQNSGKGGFFSGKQKRPQLPPGEGLLQYLVASVEIRRCLQFLWAGTRDEQHFGEVTGEQEAGNCHAIRLVLELEIENCRTWCKVSERVIGQGDIFREGYVIFREPLFLIRESNPCKSVQSVATFLLPRIIRISTDFYTDL